jgi:hypothetical protein
MTCSGKCSQGMTPSTEQSIGPGNVACNEFVRVFSSQSQSSDQIQLLCAFVTSKGRDTIPCTGFNCLPRGFDETMEAGLRLLRILVRSACIKDLPHITLLTAREAETRVEFLS